MLARLQKIFPELNLGQVGTNQVSTTESASKEEGSSSMQETNATNRKQAASHILEKADPSDFIKEFKGVPSEWHEVIQVRNQETKRVKLYFCCKFTNCNALFSKSCNLRDHFRKHTNVRPFQCDICQKTFTQSGNLGRHYKNIHQLERHVSQLKTFKPFQITKVTKDGMPKVIKSRCITSDASNDNI